MGSMRRAGAIATAWSSTTGGWTEMIWKKAFEPNAH
jgi:hypothetical protein